MRIAFALGIVVIAIVAGVFLMQSEPEGVFLTPTHTLQIAGVGVDVVLANTPELRTQGLSGVTALGDHEGMLFVFEEDGRHSFWMKDMLFPIDILWLSWGGNVLHIEKTVQPTSYPEALVPPVSARYVLEVPSGFSDTYGIKNGTRATLIEKGAQ